MKKYKDIEIIEMYKSGLSCPKIGKKIGIATSTVEKMLKQNDVPRRGRAEAGRKYHFNENFFETIDTEAKAYFLGFIIADGSVSEVRRNLTIAISQKDEEILFQFAKEVEVDCNIIKKTDQPQGYSLYTKISRMSLISKQLIDSLVKLGIRQNKTFTVRCPQIIESLRRHLWRGIFDGDGWVSIYKQKNSSISTLECGICGNYFLISDFSNLLNFLNIKHKISKDKSIYRIRLNAKRALKFLSYIYENATVFLQRKRSLFDLYSIEINRLNEKNLGKIPGIVESKHNSFYCRSLVSHCGVKKYLGVFKTLEEAVCAQNDFHLKYKKY